MCMKCKEKNAVGSETGSIIIFFIIISLKIYVFNVNLPKDGYDKSHQLPHRFYGTVLPLPL